MTWLPRRSRAHSTPLASIGLVAAVVLAAALTGPTATASPQGPMATAHKTGLNSQFYGLTVAPKSSDAWTLVQDYDPSVMSIGEVVLHRHHNHWSKVSVKGTPAATTYLNGVAAASPKQIWLVGDRYDTSTSSYLPMLAKSTGAAFKQVPLTGFTAGRLIAVGASSASNVWVIGETADYTSNVSFHWNGKKWKQVAFPANTNGAVDPAVVSTSGPTNAWVVVGGQVIDHWNGHTWSVTPLPSGSDHPQSIATSGAHTWAVGFATPGLGAPSSRAARQPGRATPSAVAQTRPLALRWSGSAWKSVTLTHASKNVVLEGVAVLGSTAQAVGRRKASATSNNAVPVAAKLHGTKGRVVTAAAFGKYSTLHVVAESSKSILAVGDYETKGLCKSPFHALAETFAHSTWSRVKIPANLVPASKTGAVACG